MTRRDRERRGRMSWWVSMGEVSAAMVGAYFPYDVVAELDSDDDNAAGSDAELAARVQTES